MLSFFLLLLLPSASDLPSQYEILEHVKLNVEVQLARYANYTCVQTVERTYYEERNACLVSQPHGKRHIFMRDRLRLDVAVSEGKEIYSWHGENKFTSSNITHVIPEGPRTSGQFTGFLRNIFTTPGTLFTFKGSTNIDSQAAYAFDYTVQLLRSTYYIQGTNYGSVVPFHGSFAVNADTFDLMQLSVIADEIPMATGMCSARTEMDYQMVNISGKPALLPASYVMKVEDNHDLYTVNRNEYSQCREFRGESTLIFKPVDPVATASTRHVMNEQLPAGLVIEASLDNPIDDKDSYEGDAVQATLSRPVKFADGQTVIPKGAKVHGVISKLEEHSSGLDFWLLGIKLERVESSEDSYLVNASPLPVSYGTPHSRFGSERALVQQDQEAARRGFWFMDGSHFKLPKHATRSWRTIAPNAKPEE